MFKQCLLSLQWAFTSRNTSFRSEREKITEITDFYICMYKINIFREWQKSMKRYWTANRPVQLFTSKVQEAEDTEDTVEKHKNYHFSSGNADLRISFPMSFPMLIFPPPSPLSMFHETVFNGSTGLRSYPFTASYCSSPALCHPGTTLCMARRWMLYSAKTGAGGPQTAFQTKERKKK